MTELYPEIEPHDHVNTSKHLLADIELLRKHAWLDDGILLREAASLAGIPGVMIHGRLDFGAPFVTAWELAQAWPDGELVIVSGTGHSYTDPGMSEGLVAATDRFAVRR